MTFLQPARYYSMLLSIMMIAANYSGFTQKVIWTWEGGNKEAVTAAANYGTKGVTHPDNSPGERFFATTWRDNEGNLWLFGGQRLGGYLNDLWKYDGTDWTWIKGSSSTNSGGNFGEPGVAASANEPPARRSPVAWTDSEGNLWLFSGISSGGYRNDLWKFDGQDWIWVGGSNLLNDPGNVASSGVPDPNNQPGARYVAVSAKKSNGDIYVFGGLTSPDNRSPQRPLNDFWKFDGTNWTFLGGDPTEPVFGSYGDKGVPDATNWPGSRAGAVAWIDRNDDFYVFGGLGLAESGTGQLNDLWRFDGQNWTWLTGYNSVDRAGSYGVKRQSDPANTPGGRFDAASALDADGNLILFGGRGRDVELVNAELNDLWIYDFDNWTWIGGDSLSRQYGDYGSVGVGAESNFPGAKVGFSKYKSETGQILMYGGSGYQTSTIGTGDDLWSLYINTPPKLAAITGPVASTDEDIEVEISFTDLLSQSDASDNTGSIVAFTVESLSSGQLRIGTDSQSATLLDPVDNYRITPSIKGYWTPDPNQNGPEVAAFTVKVEDNDEARSIGASIVSVEVRPVNDLPVFESFASGSFAENETTTVDIDANDGDGGMVDASVSYSISGPDAGLFSISEQGVISFNTPPDFENPADSDTDNQYQITIGADDGQPENNTASVDIVLTITDVNEAPTIDSPSDLLVDENVTGVIFDFDATDGDRGLADENIVYSLSGGSDVGNFSIDPSTGELNLLVATDFEQPADANADNQYTLEVSVDDGNNVTSRTITVTVQDLNDEFPIVESPDNFSVEENSKIVGEISVSDADASGDPELSIAGGEDADLFQLQAGILTFRNAPDYELPQDADMNNEYQVLLRAFDGQNETFQSITVVVENLNDNFPVFTNESTISLSENVTEVVALTATDGDPGDVLSYSIVDGVDAGQFTLQDDKLLFTGLPDYEEPTDDNGDNVYLVDVTVSDGQNITNQSIVVSVLNVNDNMPVFESSTSYTVAENSNVAGILTVTDADAESEISLQIDGGPDASRFSVQGDRLSFTALPDFESPVDNNSDNVYEVSILASDGINQVTQALTITVTDINDNTPELTIPASIQLTENTREVLTLSAEDADAGTVLTYDFAGGPDDSHFVIVGNVLSFINPPDRERPADADADNVYELGILVSDGVNNTSRSIAVTITDLNDTPPTLTTQQAVFINENQTRVSSIEASDEDLVGTLFLSIGGGADQSRFLVDGSELYFVIAPDYENPLDANQDNVYEIEIALTDGVFTTTRMVQVEVANINDNIPEFSLTSKIAMRENSTLVSQLAGSDADENTQLQFVIYGGVDADYFQISDNQLEFIVAPDFEQPTDTNGDNRYDVVVAAFDGKFYRPQEVEVIVDNINDNAPVFSLSNRIELLENEKYVANIEAEDPDGSSLSYRLAESPDRSLFSLVASELRFRQAPNFERPGDADADNSYELVLVVSDGEFEDRLNVQVLVLDVTEIAGDINGNGKIDAGEIAGDSNNDGIIGEGEIAGDLNGNGKIDPGEIAGDLNGNGIIDDSELAGDVNGNGRIDENEQEGDTDGDGQVDTKEGTEVVLSTVADEAQVRLYPNPARDYFHLSAMHWPGILEIRDSSGKLVKSITYQKGMEVSVEGLAPGLYLVHFQSDKQNVLLKLFKQ